MGRCMGVCPVRAHLDTSRLPTLPNDEAQQELHQILLGALVDKQSENFQGEVTVMKFIEVSQSAAELSVS